MTKLTLMLKLRTGHDSGQAMTGKSALAATPGR
jgi:hypothetical protein